MRKQSDAKGNEEEKHEAENVIMVDNSAATDNETTKMGNKSKTKRGTNVDKHCIVKGCSSMGKKIKGNNWYKHK
jgi:hypothetical protein